MEGNLSYSGGLRIDGTVKGDVQLRPRRSRHGHHQRTRTRRLAKFTRRIWWFRARSPGRFYVTDVLELQPKAQVAGDVHYRAMKSIMARWSKAA